MIAPSDLSPNLLKMGSAHNPPEELGPDAFSSMLGVNRNGDHMPFWREDDITQDFFSHLIGTVAY